MKSILIKGIKFFIPALISIGIIAMAGIYLLSFILGPPDLSKAQTTIYYSKSGDVIGQEQGLEQGYYVPIDDISPHMIDAIIASEDQHFFDHGGFDLKRIFGAALTDLKTMSLREGASTITQQYARNLFLSHEKTWKRKISEAFYTVRLEMHYDKETILEGYLNTIYFGHGAYGIEAASQHFFNKTAEELTLAEAAMLAGIPKGPTYYSPFNDFDKAKQRQQRILQHMYDEEMISEQDQFLAKWAQLSFNDSQDTVEKRFAPHFFDTALLEAAHILNMDPELVRSSGYHIYTTLEETLQKTLDSTVQNTVAKDSDIEVGAIAMSPETGGIQALVGGRSYEDSQFNRAIQAKRMPGSAFKPILYYAALEHGYNAKTRLISKPTAFKLDNGEVYQPSNFNDYYAYEPITLAQALAVSDNIFAVKTNLFIGTDALIEAAHRFGIERELPEVPSLALGTASVSMADMTTAYSRLANGGKAVDAHTIQKIVSQDGKTVFERDVNDDTLTTVLDPKKAFILTQLMTGMFDTSLNGHMTVTGADIAHELTREYAGKSGSTESDRWMLGFSPNIVTGVWNGYDDNRTIDRVAESGYAKDIWANFMERAHEGKPVASFEKPEGIISLNIDPNSGLRATPYCDTSRVMYFEKGTEPQQYCTQHMPSDELDIPHPRDEVDDDKKGVFEKWFDILFGL
ncbi:transglycosylase domain-containing protein [Lentibacillus saliphilus]|uniref:transglycosylase domain-containing protein n=1 Tax=Lentibacillus saliphilus TaxID=2737028 RepID=UPI001C2F46CB|nr:transglycosylase domain-containing protein [Lentibacillus saliphilus]